MKRLHQPLASSWIPSLAAVILFGQILHSGFAQQRVEVVPPTPPVGNTNATIPATAPPSVSQPASAPVPPPNTAPIPPPATVGTPPASVPVRPAAPPSAAHSTTTTKTTTQRVIVPPQTPPVQETVTTTTAEGEMGKFGAQSISIVPKPGSPEVRYVSSSTTNYVDENGNPVDGSLVPPGNPVTVKYTKVGDTLFASEVVVHAPKPVRTVVTQEKQTTTTKQKKKAKKSED